MGRKGLKYKVGQLEKKIEGLVSKIDDTYKVHPILLEAYNKDRTNILLAKKNAQLYIHNEFNYVFNICNNYEIEQFIDGFVQINYSYIKGNAELFCYHYFKLIEFVLNKFMYQNPGRSIIQPIIEKVDPKTKSSLIQDLFQRKKKYSFNNYANDIKLSVDENENKWKRISNDDMNTIFLRLLFATDKTCTPIKYVPGAQNCPQFNLDTYTPLKYHRDKFSHFGVSVYRPYSSSQYIISHLNNPSLIMKSKDAKRLLKAYLYLYNEFLKGNIKI